jgi:hypothetical protein
LLVKLRASMELFLRRFLFCSSLFGAQTRHFMPLALKSRYRL